MDSGNETGYSLNLTIRFATMKRFALSTLKSRIQVVLGVFRFSVAVVNSGCVFSSACQSSFVGTALLGA